MSRLHGLIFSLLILTLTLNWNPAVVEGIRISPAQGFSVFWNGVIRQLGLGYHLNPLRFSRAYTLVHVAVYDALLVSSHRHGSALSESAIAAGAAGQVLAHLFPRNASMIWESVRAQAWSSKTVNRGVVESGLHVGLSVGKSIARYAENDGSNAVFDGRMPTGDCVWTGVSPVEPLAGSWKTWIVSSGAEFQPEAPYPCGSEDDLRDTKAVIDASRTLTSEELHVVHKWADLPPPTIWNDLLTQWVKKKGMGEDSSARAFAYLNIAIYDAFVSTWYCKYTFWTARPFQRIPGFAPAIPTPNFPSYISGHSTTSSAASRVMSQLFPSDRDYFTEQAQEAAKSRLWAGIHFPHDNEQGLIVGGEIGDKVVDDMMGAPHTFPLPTNEAASE